MTKLLIAFFLLAAYNSFAQTLQQVTDNGNTTSKGIHAGGTSTVNGMIFETVDTYYRQLRPEGFNLNISNGAGDGKLYLPFSNTMGNVRLYYYGLNIDKYLGVGTTNPQAGIQLGDLSNNITGKQIVIPGVYNFEQMRLGQFGNGNMAIEFVNHQAADISYGMKMEVNVDHAPGLNFQYAVAQDNYNSLDYQTGMFLGRSGYVGIGTTTPQEKLSVNGKIRAKEIKVETANWPDYVFKPGYEKMGLAELEKFINNHGHLPDVPTAAEVDREGIALGEMNKILLQKIEELTLYLIEKNKEILQLKTEKSEKDEVFRLLFMKQDKEIQILKKHLNIK